MLYFKQTYLSSFVLSLFTICADLSNFGAIIKYVTAGTMLLKASREL